MVNSLETVKSLCHGYIFKVNDMKKSVKVFGVTAFLFFLIKGLFWLGLILMTYNYMP